MFSNLEKNRKNLENLSKIDFFGQNGQNSSKIGQKQAIIGFQTTQKWSKMVKNVLQSRKKSKKSRESL